MKINLIGGRWKIEKSLGEGGQAHTFLVEDINNGSNHWVLKRLKNNKRLDRFKREIEALDALSSPHIPKTVDYSVNDPAYHVTPLLGESLDKYIEKNGPLPISIALDIFLQIVSAVKSAHEKAGVIHRDIKPNNIIISSDGIKAYLIDFGICQYENSELTMLTTDEPFGNAAFSAPECLLGREEPPGPACDVYSLGKVWYWMISNGNHIQRENITEASIDRIQSKNELIQSYLTHLLYKTLRETPISRVSISKLEDSVIKIKKLVENVLESEKNGVIILTDNFGSGNNFSNSSYKSITSPNRGNPPSNFDIGIPFKIPDEYDCVLHTITLAIKYEAGIDELDLLITNQIKEEPDLDNILKHFKISSEATRKARIENIYSQDSPLLSKGEQYWVVLSVPNPNSEIRLWSGDINLIPKRAISAKRINGGEWIIGDSKQGPGYAVRITVKKKLLD